ncbi:MAG: hypothetical protein ACQEWU_16235 [Bacillota bacterium]
MKKILTKRNMMKKGKVIIPIEGDKVTSVHILLSTMLTEKEVVIKNVPSCLDLLNILNFLADKKDVIKENNNLICKKNKVKSFEDIRELNNCSRASIGLISALTSKNSSLKFCNPGGCTFSKRPIDLHLHLLGNIADISTKNNEEYQAILNHHNIKESDLSINCGTKTGTSIGVFFNAISCAYTNKNQITIHNYPYDNTAVQLVEMLQSTTNREVIVNSNTIIVKKTDNIQHYDANITLKPDIAMAISYILMGYSNLENLYLLNIRKGDFSENYLTFLEYIGVEIIDCNDGIQFKKKDIISKDELRVITIGQEPSITTDLGPVITSFLAIEDFNAIVIDKVYTDRKSHIAEINRIKDRMLFVNDGVIKISGDEKESKLNNVYFTANDIRAGMGIIISFLNCSIEEISIDNFDQVKRGYGNVETFLELLGVDCFEKATILS